MNNGNASSSSSSSSSAAAVGKGKRVSSKGTANNSTHNFSTIDGLQSLQSMGCSDVMFVRGANYSCFIDPKTRSFVLHSTTKVTPATVTFTPSEGRDGLPAAWIRQGKYNATLTMSNLAEFLETFKFASD